MAVEADIQESAAGGGKKRRLMIIIAAAAVVLLAAGGGLFFFMSSSQAPADAHGAVEAHAVHESFIFNLPQMTVNLNSEAGEPEAFLRMTIALEVSSEEVMHDIQPQLAKVIDAFQIYLRELRRSDLEGSAGIYRLKDELMRRINMSIYPSRVESILFRELLVQ
jgi:flagellar FliL protein